MRLASEEPTYSVGGTLPNGEEVIELIKIHHSTQPPGWLYCTGEDEDHRYTEKQLEEMKHEQA